MQYLSHVQRGGVKCAVPFAAMCAEVSPFQQLVKRAFIRLSFGKSLIMLVKHGRNRSCKLFIQDHKSLAIPALRSHLHRGRTSQPDGHCAGRVSGGRDSLRESSVASRHPYMVEAEIRLPQGYT